MDRGDFSEYSGTATLTVPRIVIPSRPKVYSVDEIVRGHNLPQFATVAGQLYQCSVGEGLLSKTASLVLRENNTKLYLNFEIHPLSGDLDRLSAWTNAYVGKAVGANIDTRSREAYSLMFGSKMFDLV